jgi:hypothetical protein
MSMLVDVPCALRESMPNRAVTIPPDSVGAVPWLTTADACLTLAGRVSCKITPTDRSSAGRR